MRRRTYLRTAGGLAATGLLAGCMGGGDENDYDRGPNEVLAGPDGRNVFEPQTITVSTGETVTWRFLELGHNVECDPEVSDLASAPDGADPFASYEGNNRFATNEGGTTFEHPFEVPGTYHYVCVPHARQGMVGDVVVEE